MSVPFMVSIARLAVAESGISMKQYLAALPFRSTAIRTFTDCPTSMYGSRSPIHSSLSSVAIFPLTRQISKVNIVQTGKYIQSNRMLVDLKKKILG
ncbi:hypothetical protein D917_08725 [Trichinella nativa]|uniref:Uncharacterized protein n=1 Tax=Trichinella nativa TaxID=6335 RepID=A0A1Y3EIK4_9BILA|nr:hypothetical protein D917_08725 [Trichinella nativa]